ncbi:MAG: hypothetical protein C5B56_01050 [Proteobacteria bacterium]|nr:MAG: hypothetical protein C5B56_01050 [Pseudomonadota bacterium]
MTFPLEVESNGPMKVVLVWTLPDGSARYRVTVQRFAWLKPMVHKVSDMLCVPTRVEILRIGTRTTPLPELSRT